MTKKLPRPKSTMIVHILSMALLLLSVACQQQQPATQNAPQAAASPNTAQWDAYVNEFLNNYFTAHPDAGVLAGRHEFDGKLPDWSDEGIKREIARLHSERDRAMKFDAASLDERTRFERDYLVAQIDKDLFWMESAD